MKSWGRKRINREETAYWLDQVIPAPLEFRIVEERPLALARLEGGQSLAATTTFAEFDSGLTTISEANADSSAERDHLKAKDVRCELLTVARASEVAVAAAVIAAAEALEKAGGLIPAQPGTMLPEVLDGTPLGEDDSVTVAHGLLIPPYLWGGPAPQVEEDDRITLPCQLLLLTDSEYAFAVEEGVAAFQQAAAEANIDFLDLSRSDS